MEVHGSSWEFMGVHGSSWEFMGVHGSSWEFMAGYLLLRNPLNCGISESLVVVFVANELHRNNAFVIFDMNLHNMCITSCIVNHCKRGTFQRCILFRISRY